MEAFNSPESYQVLSSFGSFSFQESTENKKIHKKFKISIDIIHSSGYYK